MKQTISEGINFNFLLRDVYATNCYFRIFFIPLPYNILLFEVTMSNVLWKSYQKISRAYLQYITFYLKNNIFVFFQMSALQTTFLIVSIYECSH